MAERKGTQNEAVKPLRKWPLVILEVSRYARRLTYSQGTELPFPGGLRESFWARFCSAIGRFPARELCPGQAILRRVILDFKIALFKMP